MTLYYVRWPNGDLSFVQAANKTQAAIALDEAGPVEPRDVKCLPPGAHFMLHLALGDEGHLEMEGLGERLQGWVDETCYPVLHDALLNDHDIPAAVEAERNRLADIAIDALPGAAGELQTAMGASSAYMMAVLETAAGVKR